MNNPICNTTFDVDDLKNYIDCLPELNGELLEFWKEAEEKSLFGYDTLVRESYLLEYLQEKVRTDWYRKPSFVKIDWLETLERFKSETDVQELIYNGNSYYLV